MDTFYQFLRINAADPDDLSLQESIFKGTKIYEDREFCHEFMGKFPVISVSFKEVEGNYYKEAVSRLAQTIVALAEEHKYLLKSDKLDELDKNKLLKLLNYDVLMKDPEYGELSFALRTLSKLLYLHFNRQVIVLIDEYDVPISKAYDGGYYQEMINLIRGMLSSSLKDDALIFKGILSGCLRVSKESIFTGFNNCDVNTVINDSGFLAQCIGFTKGEVHAMLDYYDLLAYEGAVKEWYDGYKIAGREIFCPWDVVCFCKKAVQERRNGDRVSDPASFWTNSSTSNVIAPFMPYLDNQQAERMQILLDGGTIDFVVNEKLNYIEINELHDSNHFWTLLLYTGYLTSIESRKVADVGLVCTARIPNRELKEAFKTYIAAYYKDSSIVRNSSNDIACALLNGDAQKANMLLESRLDNFVSVRDLWTCSAPENFYQGFLDGILSTANSKILMDYRSNELAGDGFADIVFKGHQSNSAVVIELKVTLDYDKLLEFSQLALQQIDEKNYIDAVKGANIKKVYCYGIAFCHKYCKVLCNVRERK